MDVNVMYTTTPNRIPDVFQRLLDCLEEESSPVSWTLSKSIDGCFSMRILEIPAKQERPCKQTTSEVKLKASGQVVSPSGNQDSKPIAAGNKSARRRKSPAQLKRDRQRRATWRLKQKLSRENRQAAAATAKPAPRESVASEDSVDSVSPESATVSETLDIRQAEPVCEETLPLDSDPPSAGIAAEPVSVTTSVLDQGGFETCANCDNVGGPSVKLSACSRCKAVKYCGVACQREQWPVHKSACAILRRMNEQLGEL